MIAFDRTRDQIDLFFSRGVDGEINENGPESSPIHLAFHTTGGGHIPRTPDGSTPTRRKRPLLLDAASASC